MSSDSSDDIDTSAYGSESDHIHNGVKIVVPSHLNPVKKPKKKQKDKPKDPLVNLKTINEETEEHQSSMMSSLPSGVSIHQADLDNF